MIHTLRPRTPASKRDERALELSALSGTNPPQKPGQTHKKKRRDLGTQLFFFSVINKCGKD